MPAMRRAVAAGLAAVLAGAVAVVAVLVFSSPGKPPLPVAAPGPLRLGFVTDLADAPALAGLRMGFLGAGPGGSAVDATAYESPVQEAAALLDGKLDAAYVDPVTAVAVWQAWHESGLEIVAGAASGGTELVARAGITRPGQLARLPVAAPPGSAQEVALDYWLRSNQVPGTAPGNVTMTGAYLTQALRSGRLAAAWEPAPADAELTAAGGRVLVDEASLWPGGQYTSAVLVVTSRYLSAHPAAVTALLRGQVQAVQYLVTDPVSADKAAGTELAAVAGPALPATVLAQGFSQVTFTDNPLPATVLAEAAHAADDGMLAPVTTLSGLLDLGPLNKILESDGRQPVST
jgi:NitT/TauT family transport system substrate-binding protein